MLLETVNISSLPFFSVFFHLLLLFCSSPLPPSLPPSHPPSPLPHTQVKDLLSSSPVSKNFPVILEEGGSHSCARIRYTASTHTQPHSVMGSDPLPPISLLPPSTPLFLAIDHWREGPVGKLCRCIIITGRVSLESTPPSIPSFL